MNGAGPSRSVVSQPLVAAALARAAPMRPEERFPMKRTESMGSCVGPAVMSRRGLGEEAASRAGSEGLGERDRPLDEDVVKGALWERTGRKGHGPATWSQSGVEGQSPRARALVRWRNRGAEGA